MRKVIVAILLASAVWIATIWALHTSAFAATYRITDVQNVKDKDFRSTIFHDATKRGGKKGAILEKAKPHTASGTWNDQTGAFNLDFRLKSGRTVSAQGNLLLPGNNDGSVIGKIDFTFSSAVNGLTTHLVKFLDWGYDANVGTQPNGMDGLSLALLGVAGKPSVKKPGSFNMKTTTLGANLRLALAPAPLPTSSQMLGIGVVVLLWLAWRRQRKQSGGSLVVSSSATTG